MWEILPKKKEKKEREREKRIARWSGIARREHTEHYSRVSSDEDAINPDPIPSSVDPRLFFRCFTLVSPVCLYFTWRGFTFGHRHRHRSFDDRSRGCSQLQLKQFPGSPAPEPSPTDSPSVSLFLTLFLFNVHTRACLSFLLLSSSLSIPLFFHFFSHFPPFSSSMPVSPFFISFYISFLFFCCRVFPFSVSL